MSPTNIQEKILVVLLRLGGFLMVPAFLAIFLPVEWMASIHAWLGLGEYPHGILVDYLNRSISGLYGIHGGLLLLVSTDVRRFSRIVRYLAVMDVVFGAVMIGVDLHAGMPWFWTINEGPPIIAAGAAMLYLLRFVPAE